MELKKTLLMPKTGFEMRGNLPNKEPSFIALWKEKDIYHKLLAKNASNQEFSFHDGPPYANGDIHCGHMLNNLLKDFIVRYKSMSGFYTPFVFGFDTHGLPIENKVGKLSEYDRSQEKVVDFIHKCRDYALKQVKRQSDQLERLGVLADLSNPYLTLNNEYVAHQIELFGMMALKGLIYKGLKPVYWSPSSESALAEAEIEYHDIKSHSIYVAFDVCDGKEDIVPNGTKAVIWTTTPWTLPANLAISVHPRFEYGLYETEHGKLLLLKTLAEATAKEIGLKQLTLIKTVKGKELEGIKTKHPFYDRLSPIIVGEHVTEESGTGLVHTAPGHGGDDYVVCVKYHIAPYCPVDAHGYLDASVGERLAGLFYEDANSVVLDILRENGALLAQKEIVHAYPHDWRTKKPLIFRATPQWFCSIEKIKDELLEQVKNINWLPAWGKQRMDNMISDRTDWCISRQRIWGVPLPIIYAEDGTPLIEKEIFDSIADIFRKEGPESWFVNEAKYFLPKNYHSSHSPNDQFSKEKDIMDVWFDSGSSFYDVIYKRGRKFPCDLYLEGNDQYRGWFNASMTISTACFGVAPFKTCLTHGWVLDEDSEKMSKSKGNGIDPSKVANTVGADILRLWVATIDYRQDVRLSDSLIAQVSEQYRRIRNTFKFLLGNLYIDETRVFEPATDFVNSKEFVDRAILAKLDVLKNEVIDSFDNYDFAPGIMKINSFIIGDLSNFYLDIMKDVLYCEGVTSLRRKEAQSTIYKIAETLIYLLAPILSFTCEEAYKFLKNNPLESVMLEDYPSKATTIDTALLKQFDDFMAIRSNVLKELEKARQSGLIGSSQEAQLILGKNESDFIKTLSIVDASEIARLFIVSKVAYSTEDNIQVIKADGHKCPRCWNYVDELVMSQTGEKVCSRCQKVLENIHE